MFLRCTTRKKNGKEHRYWNLVENRRVAGGQVVQRQVLYLGEINDSQQEVWRKSIEETDSLWNLRGQHLITIRRRSRWSPWSRCQTLDAQRPADQIPERAVRTSFVGNVDGAMLVSPRGRIRSGEVLVLVLRSLKSFRPLENHLPRQIIHLTVICTRTGETW
jgi:hypothetical protein